LGGPFHTVRGFIEDIPQDIQVDRYQRFNDPYSYKGPAYIPRIIVGSSLYMDSGVKSLDDIHLPFFSDSERTDFGTHAIAATAPTNPASTVAIGLGEILKDGIPRVPLITGWERKLSSIPADEYLNYVFGWHPLAEEVKEVSQAIAAHHKVLKDYIDGAEKSTRREYNGPVDFQTTEEDIDYNPPVDVGDEGNYLTGGPNARYKKRTSTTKKMWFKGCFTYGVPSGLKKLLGYGSEANKIFGTTLSPDVLWELTPWSWAVDWFTDASDVIHNFTEFELNGLAMRYGYLMEEVIYREEYECLSTGLAVSGKSGLPRLNVVYISKRRIPASPYGFEVSWEGLSTSQLLITAALGITRLGKLID